MAVILLAPTGASLVGACGEGERPLNTERTPNDAAAGPHEDTQAPGLDSGASSVASTPDSGSAGSAPTEAGVAGFDLMACREICAELAVVACDGPESACLGRCAVEQTAFSGTACQHEFEAIWPQTSPAAVEFDGGMIPVGTFETIEVPEGQAPQLTKSAQATQEEAQDVLDAADEGSRYRRRRSAHPAPAAPLPARLPLPQTLKPSHQGGSPTGIDQTPEAGFV